MSGPERSIAVVVLGGTFRIAAAHALRFVALAAITGGTWAAISLATLRAGSSLLIYWVLVLLWPAFLVVQLAASAEGALREVRNEAFGVWSALGAGVRRAPVGLLVGAVAVSVFAPAAEIDGRVAGATAAVLGLACVVLPAALAERAGVLHSLRRAVALSRGERVGVAAALGLLAALAFGVAPLGMSSLLAEPKTAFGVWLMVLKVSHLWAALVASLPAIGAAVAYVELRERREGERLGRVFG